MTTIVKKLQNEIKHCKRIVGLYENDPEIVKYNTESILLYQNEIGNIKKGKPGTATFTVG
jgi:hypothetical protein